MQPHVPRHPELSALEHTCTYVTQSKFTPLVWWLLTEQEAGLVGRIYFKKLLYNFGSFRLQCSLSAYGCSLGDALSELYGHRCCFSFALLCSKLSVVSECSADLSGQAPWVPLLRR